MDKLDALFIRACKSSNPHKRLQSVYRRFFGVDLGSTVDPLINILARICSDYNLINLEKFVSAISPHNRWTYADETTDPNEWDMRYLVLASTVKFTPVNRFGPDYPKPLKFRRMERERNSDCI